jgi:hypothetical protein
MDALAHRVGLPSGMRVCLRLPALPELILGGLLPDRLRALVLAATPAAEEPAEELEEGAEGLLEALGRRAEAEGRLLAGCLVEPLVVADELEEVPAPDRELLGALLLRDHDRDAGGVRLGLAPLGSFAAFVVSPQAVRTAVHARRAGAPFPRLTRVRCGCGCGGEGEDEVTQYLLEEACFLALDLAEQAAFAKAEAEAERLPEGLERPPGQVSDPALLEALEKAKALHRQLHGWAPA